MAGWVFWILAAIFLAVGEMLTMGFFLAPFAGGALLAALVDAAGGGTVLSWGIFIVTSLLLLLVVRPIARSCSSTGRAFQARMSCRYFCTMT